MPMSTVTTPTTWPFARIGAGETLLLAATKLAVKSTGFGALAGAFERDGERKLVRCATAMPAVPPTAIGMSTDNLPDDALSAIGQGDMQA